MKAVVVFESMYGNTRAIAESVAKGIRAAGDAEVTVASVSEADSELIREADLLVVGGPTHAHGMSHPATRPTAKMLRRSRIASSGSILQRRSTVPGLRGWLAHLDGRESERSLCHPARCTISVSTPKP